MLSVEFSNRIGILLQSQLRILNELEEEGNSNAQIHDEKQPASIIIIDR